MGAPEAASQVRAVVSLLVVNTRPPSPLKAMLWTIFVVLLVLWFLGMVSSYTLGGYIHILLVLAVVALLIRLISGRSVI